MDQDQTKRAFGEAMGIPASEIADVLDSPAGPIVVTTDGVSYVQDASDGGRWKYAAKPTEKYNDAFPVYQMPAGVDQSLSAATASTRRRRRRAEPGTNEARVEQAANDLATGPREGEDDDVDLSESLEAKVDEREGVLPDDLSLEEDVLAREGVLPNDTSLEENVALREGDRDSGVLDLSALDKEELLKVARDRGIAVKASWSPERIRETIQDAGTS